MFSSVAAKVSTVSGTRRDHLPPYSELFQKLGTRSGIDWQDETGDTTRNPLPSFCLNVSNGLSITLPPDDDGGSAVISGLVDGVDYAIDGHEITFFTTKTVTGILVYDSAEQLVDKYVCCEGSGTLIYSVLRAGKAATLGEGITWGYQTTVPNYSNLNGYLDSSGVIVPMLLDRSGFADGNPISAGYSGKVAWPARFRQGHYLSTAANGVYQGIVSAATPNELIGKSSFSIAFWGHLPSSYTLLRVGAYRGSTYQIAVNLTSSESVDFAVCNGELAYLSCPLPSPRQPHHIVAVFNGSLVGNARGLVYIDGTPCSGGTYTGIMPASTMSDQVPLKIGVVAGPSNSGRVADVQIYDHALSAPEISALYQTGLRPALPGLEWPLCEGAGQNGWDVAGVNHWTSTIPAATMWANRQDITCYPLTNGYQDCLIGSDHVCVPRKLDGSWINPAATSAVNHPALVNGFNGSPNLDICKLDLLPSYGGHIPAEMADIYDLLTVSGTNPVGGYGDYRDFTASFTQLLALKTDSVGANLRRRLCARTLKDATGNVIGISKLWHYVKQEAANRWNRVLLELGDTSA